MAEFSDKRSMQEVYLDTYNSVARTVIEQRIKFEKASLTITVGAIVLSITFLTNLTEVAFIEIYLFLTALILLSGNLILVLIALYLSHSDFSYLRTELKKWKEEEKCKVDFVDYYQESLSSKIAGILDKIAFFFVISGLILLTWFGYVNIVNINQTLLDAEKTLPVE